MQNILATIIHGLGHASGKAHDRGPENGTILLQKPLLKKYLPEIVTCHNGTINLLLDSPFEVRIPEIVTPPLRWRPSTPKFDERFGLSEVAFFLSGKTYRAWLYMTEKSPHLLKTGVVELLAEYIPDVSYGQRCSIIIERARQASLAVL